MFICRSAIRLLVVITMICVSSAFYSQTTTAQGDQRCFPETGKCISGAIRAYWERNGGLPVFGFPLTDVSVQRTGDGWEGPVQWFERDRLEDHGNGSVLAGRLGADILFLEGHPWETLPKGVDRGDCRFFPETGQRLCEPFLSYWTQNGGVERFGYPISQLLTERNADGWAGGTQWFERRRMEYHDEGVILLGLLGTDIVNARVSPHSPAAAASRAYRIINNGMWKADGVCAAGPWSVRFQLDANVMHSSGDIPGSQVYNTPISIREIRNDRVVFDTELYGDRARITLFVVDEKRLRFFVNGEETFNLVDYSVPCREMTP